MHADQPPATLLPQVRLFHQALGLPCAPENSLFHLAESLDSELGRNELLYELAGTASESEVDLSCFLNGIRGGMACHLPALRQLDIPSPWLHLLAILAREQNSHPDSWLDWRGLWLEFDSSLSSRTRPNLFITIANEKKQNREILCRTLDLIRERIDIDPVIDQGIKKILGDLPPSISVVQTGFLLPRAGGQRVKICLVGITPADFFLLQQKLALPLSRELSTIWLNIMEAQPNWVCALDLYPDGTIAPAFEIQATSRGWNRILSHLPAPQGALARLDITTPKIQSCLRSGEWPPFLLRQWQENPSITESRLVTLLNHIKIASHQKNHLQVKYYFLQKPWFKRRQGDTQ
jgi:hypothetical protein